MADGFPLPDIERGRTIIDALGAMVVGEPCPACAGEGGREGLVAPGTTSAASLTAAPAPVTA